MTTLSEKDQSIITQVAAKIAADLVVASGGNEQALDGLLRDFVTTTSTVKEAILSEHGVSLVKAAFPGTVQVSEPAVGSSVQFTQNPETQTYAYRPADVPQTSGAAPAIPGVQDGDPDTAAMWTEFFNDPSRWWNNSKDKRNPRSPDLKHKDNSDKALWFTGKKNPSWVPARLAQLGLA